MGFELDVSEVRALGSQVGSAGARIGAAGSAILRRTAYAIQGDAQALAPVDTGNLRNSISTTTIGDGRAGAMTAEIGPTAEYAIYVHEGTSVMPGRPFLSMAFDRRVSGYTEALARAAAGEIL